MDETKTACCDDYILRELLGALRTMREFVDTAEAKITRSNELQLDDMITDVLQALSWGSANAQSRVQNAVREVFRRINREEKYHAL